MKKIFYIPPHIVFEEIEEQDCIMGASNRPEPDINTPYDDPEHPVPPIDGAIWGEEEDDI